MLTEKTPRRITCERGGESVVCARQRLVIIVWLSRNKIADCGGRCPWLRSPRDWVRQSYTKVAAARPPTRTELDDSCRHARELGLKFETARSNAAMVSA